MSRLKGGTAFTNPLYHLEAFSLNNPFVQWAIERGAYRPDMCLTCRGTGQEMTPNGAVIKHVQFVDDKVVRDKDGVAVRVPGVCRVCRGRGSKPDRAVHASDFGDAESRAVAEALGTRIQEHDFQCPGDNRCRCILRAGWR